VKEICNKALSGYPNSSELLSQVQAYYEESFRWVPKLFEVTKKSCWYLFIDEIGALEEDDLYSFLDLYPKANYRRVYKSFFGEIADIIMRPGIICVVAGVTDGFMDRQEDAGSALLHMKFLFLDPFSESETKFLIQGMKASNEQTALKLLFPSHPEGHEWFFKQIYDYTGGSPEHVINGMED
jgi:hypothetical protein